MICYQYFVLRSLFVGINNIDQFVLSTLVRSVKNVIINSLKNSKKQLI